MQKRIKSLEAKNLSSKDKKKQDKLESEESRIKLVENNII